MSNCHRSRQPPWHLKPQQCAIQGRNTRNPQCLLCQNNTVQIPSFLCCCPNLSSAAKGLRGYQHSFAHSPFIYLEFSIWCFSSSSEIWSLGRAVHIYAKGFLQLAANKLQGNNVQLAFHPYLVVLPMQHEMQSDKVIVVGRLHVEDEAVDDVFQ